MTKSFVGILSFLILSLLLSACQQDLILDVEIPEEEAALVVNSLFNPDSLWKVQVSHTTPLLGFEKPQEVSDARVELLENGSVIEVLSYSGERQVNGRGFASTGIYRSSGLYPEVGKTYQIRVSAPSFDPVSASDAIPESVSIHASSYRKNVASDVVGPLDEIRLTFQDPAGEPNFYNIRVHSRVHDTSTGLTGSYSYGFSIISDVRDDFFGADPDQFLGDDKLFEADTDGLSFSDSFFDGQEKEIVLQLRGDNACGTSFAAIECQAVVELSTISESFYQYHRTLQLQNQTEQNPFAESIRVSSNVDNGIGIFAGYNTDVWIHNKSVSSNQ